jgi:hypothetical protein
LAGFIITKYFAVSDLSVFWDVCQFDKETCVGYQNIPNALKKVSNLVAKTSFPKWLQARVFHKGHAFHLFSGDGVNDCIVLMCLVPMVIYQGDGHVVSVHVAKVVLGQFPGGKIL